jgi:hypothetical protein
MHPKVAGAIQEIDAALYNGDTFDDPGDRAELTAYVEKWAQELGLIPSEKDGPEEYEALVRIRAEGSWRDDAGVVHAVNAARIEPDIDLGRETLCGSASWEPDNPRAYPTVTDEIVDCMTCIVGQVRSCP